MWIQKSLKIHPNSFVVTNDLIVCVRVHVFLEIEAFFGDQQLIAD